MTNYPMAVQNYWLNNDDGKWEIVKLGDVFAENRGGGKSQM